MASPRSFKCLAQMTWRTWIRRLHPATVPSEHAGQAPGVHPERLAFSSAVNPIETQPMKYVLLVYRDTMWWETISASERADFEQACQANEQDLIRRAHLVGAWDLQNNSALTVRVEQGGISVRDGPVVESREPLVRLLFIQAKDLNAAIQIASRMPQTRGGAVEVRPVPE